MELFCYKKTYWILNLKDEKIYCELLFSCNFLLVIILLPTNRVQPRIKKTSLLTFQLTILIKGCCMALSI